MPNGGAVGCFLISCASAQTQSQPPDSSSFEHLPGFLSEVAVGFGDGVWKGITFGMGDLNDVRGLFGNEYVPSDDIVYAGSSRIGEIEGGVALVGSLATKAFSRGGWLNRGPYLRIGVGKHKGDKWFRISGDWVKTETGHIDLFRLGTWP